MGIHLSSSRRRVLVVAVIMAGFGPWTARDGSSARLVDIAVNRNADGTTNVSVTMDGPAVGVRRFRMSEGQAREVVAILGVDSAYRPYEVEVGDANVHRVRIGHHPEKVPPEEHLVFDLAHDDVRLLEVTETGDRLVITLGRPSPGLQLSSPALSTQPTAQSAVPSRTPLPTRSPTKTPPPVETEADAVPSTRSPRPPTAATPRVRRSRPPSGPGRGTARVAPSNLTEVVVSQRGDGSTLVRITADRSYQPGALDFRGTGGPPRLVLRVAGAHATDRREVLEIFDGCVCSIHVTTDTGSDPPSSEVTLFLDSALVSVGSVNTMGSHFVVHLLPPSVPPHRHECETTTQEGTRSWRLDELK